MYFDLSLLDKVIFRYRGPFSENSDEKVCLKELLVPTIFKGTSFFIIFQAGRQTTALARIQPAHFHAS